MDIPTCITGEMCGERGHSVIPRSMMAKEWANAVINKKAIFVMAELALIKCFADVSCGIVLVWRYVER